MRKVFKPQQRYFPYFGAKYTLCPTYPKPKHPMIVEPFAGSAGYSTHFADRQVILNDLDPRIAAIWAFLIRSTAEDIMQLPLLAPDGCVADLKCCEEAKWFIGMWIGHSHVPRKNPSGWFRKNKTPKAYWGTHIRRRIAAQIHCIDHWTMTNDTYEMIEPVTATWFIDPPYQKAGKLYAKSDVDFPALGKWCKSREGQVIVCENIGADWLDFKPLKRVHGAYMDAKRRNAEYEGRTNDLTGSGHRKKTEAYWLNHPEDYRAIPKGLGLENPNEVQPRSVAIRAIYRSSGSKPKGSAGAE